MSFSKALMIFSIIGMVVVGHLARGKSYDSVPNDVAQQIVGAACSGSGSSVSICSGIVCISPFKKTNSGNTASGAGSLGSGSISCPCDPGGGSISVVSGTCGGTGE